MNAEIPYALYLKFKEPADALILSNVFEFLGLGFLGEDDIDGLFKVQHYHFKTDPSQKILLHVETENNTCERINISVYTGASLESIKNLFNFFNANFEEEQVVLIDQQVKNELFLKERSPLTQNNEAGEEHENQLTGMEQKATLSFSFDDFYNNPLKLQQRDQLFKNL